MRRLGTILVTAALLGQGCGGSGVPPASIGPAGPPTSSPTAGATRPPIMLAGIPLEACSVGVPAVCGTLRLPEDRSKPEGRSIDLRVAVIPAVSAVPRADPVVFLDGGPGGAATEDLGWTAGVFSALHEDRDFVLVDQRGTGSSHRLVVPEAPDTTGLTTDQAKATIERWVADALAAMPGNPRWYTTSVAMDDLDAVRAALGYEKVNLYGASYGATAAQYYLRQYPGNVRSVVLDGGSLLDVPLFERLPANSQAALDLLFERCDRDTACHAAFPNLRDDFRATLATLANGPVSTSVVHPWTGQPLVIDTMTYTAAIHTALTRVDLAGSIPMLIHAASVGSWDAVATAIAAAMGPKMADTSQLVMAAVIRCSEAWARWDPVEVARLGSTSYALAGQLAAATRQAQSCPFVPKGFVPAGDAEPVRTDLPVLLILGQADPQDPPANVADAPRDMPNSLTVVVPGAGHTVGHLGCIPGMVGAFIAAGTTKGLDTSCASTGVPLPAFLTSP